MLLSWCFLVVLLGQFDHPATAGPLERVICAEDGRSFVIHGTGQRFPVWGLNYDRDARVRLIEDYWRDEWPKVEADFQAISSNGY